LEHCSVSAAVVVLSRACPCWSHSSSNPSRCSTAGVAILNRTPFAPLLPPYYDMHYVRALVWSQPYSLALAHAQPRLLSAVLNHACTWCSSEHAHACTPLFTLALTLALAHPHRHTHARVCALVLTHTLALTQPHAHAPRFVGNSWEATIHFSVNGQGKNLFGDGWVRVAPCLTARTARACRRANLLRTRSSMIGCADVN
jgi:hypothetical protein